MSERGAALVLLHPSLRLRFSRGESQSSRNSFGRPRGERARDVVAMGFLRPDTLGEETLCAFFSQSWHFALGAGA